MVGEKSSEEALVCLLACLPVQEDVRVERRGDNGFVRQNYGIDTNTNSLTQ